MSEFAAENLIETGSIPEGKASIEEAIADMGKAATLAEWVYAGLRIESRDWSAELRKSSDVQLPKFAMLEKSVEQTGSVLTEAVEMKTALQKPIGTSVGLSLVSENNVDQALHGNREAKVMGFEDFRLKVFQDVGLLPKAVSESFKSIPPSQGKTDLPTSPTITALLDVVVDDVTPENGAEPEVPVVVIEAPTVAETLLVEKPAHEAVAPEVVVVAEPVTTVVVAAIEAPAALETPVVEEVAAEVVAPEIVVVAEPVTAVVAVVETLAVAVVGLSLVEESAAEPVVSEVITVAEAETAVIVDETPVVEESAIDAVAPEAIVIAEAEAPVVAVVELVSFEEVASQLVVVVEASVIEEPTTDAVAPEDILVAEAETPVVALVELVSVEETASQLAVIVDETPVVEESAAEPVVSEVIAVIEAETSVVVVETSVIEEPATDAVAPEDILVAEAETPVVVVIETLPVAVVELPLVEEFPSEPVGQEPVGQEPIAQEIVAQEIVASAEPEAAVVVAAVEATAAETPFVDEVAPEVVVVAEAEITALAVVELPAIEEVAAEPAMIEPLVAVVPETPAVEPIPGVGSDLAFGRLYFHNFDSSRAKIVIKSDYVSNFDDLLAQSNLYQDEASTVLELANGSDFIILTHFSVGDVSADMFVFEVAGQDGETPQVFIRETEVVTEDAVAGDVFTFGLNSGRTYVTDFDMSSDKIFIKADLFSSFDEMISRTAVYQDGSAAVFELHDSVDMMILPHFSIKNLREDMFVFEAEIASKVESYPDTQPGTDQDDILIFGAGDQLIDPGLGFDVVTGGEGNDTFIFGANSGHDFIVDFKSGEDHIKINSDLAHGFDDFRENAAIYQDGGATQIEFSGGQLITLFETNAKAVSAEWFSFG